MNRKTEETHEDEDQQETSPTPGRPLRNLAFRRTFPNSKRNGANLVQHISRAAKEETWHIRLRGV